MANKSGSDLTAELARLLQEQAAQDEALAALRDVIQKALLKQADDAALINRMYKQSAELKKRIEALQWSLGENEGALKAVTEA